MTKDKHAAFGQLERLQWKLEGDKCTPSKRLYSERKQTIRSGDSQCHFGGGKKLKRLEKRWWRGF